ncbi:steroid receptor RNA activator 1 isoform X2 [Calliopsis andreniformis]
MQKVLLPGHDPGWNDPPNWAFSATQTAATTPTKRVLNKRVAFPLASAQASNKESSSGNKPMNLPPPLQSSVSLTTASHPPLITPSSKDTESNTEEIEIDKEQALNDALANLETVVNEHILETSRAEEVKRRLDVLKTMWLEDKLNNTVHKNILDLSIALREGNVEKADQIHLALMMQNASLCTSWIPGIRHIILGLKTKQQSSSAIQSQNL